MRRIALSRLGVAIECPASHLESTEWTEDAPTWAMRSGLGFHDAVETYPAEPDMESIATRHNLTARQVEIITAQVSVAKQWLSRHYRPTWRSEVAFAFNPLTGATRELARDNRNTGPDEWYGRFDVIDPTIGLNLDWKSGRRPVPVPYENPQIWGGVAIVAKHFGLAKGEGAVVQVGEKDLEHSAQQFSEPQILTALAKMKAAHEAVIEGAPFIYGEHCMYCPAKKTCATYAAGKAGTPPQTIKEIPIMTATPSAPASPANTNNVRPISSIRMTLKNVVKGAVLSPVRVLIHAADKVGKSSFAAGAPSPVFIGMEGGLEQLGPARYPQPESFDDVLAALEDLRVSPHDFKTVVVDPVNWLERFIFQEVCKEYGKSNIDEVLGGFQKGQGRAIKFWDMMLSALDALRDERRMHVILTAHTAVRNQKNPEAQDWGSWQPAMDKVGAERMKQWVDAILFARLEEFAKSVDGKVKGRSTGARVLLTQSNAAYAAGNRFGLPEELPLSWADFWRAVETGHGTAEALRTEARALATELGVTEKCEAFLAEAGPNVEKIVEVINALKLKKGA